MQHLHGRSRRVLHLIRASQQETSKPVLAARRTKRKREREKERQRLMSGLQCQFRVGNTRVCLLQLNGCKDGNERHCARLPDKGSHLVDHCAAKVDSRQRTGDNCRCSTSSVFLVGSLGPFLSCHRTVPRLLGSLRQPSLFASLLVHYKLTLAFVLCAHCRCQWKANNTANVASRAVMKR